MGKLVTYLSVLRYGTKRWTIHTQYYYWTNWTFLSSIWRGRGQCSLYPVGDPIYENLWNLCTILWRKLLISGVQKGENLEEAQLTQCFKVPIELAVFLTRYFQLLRNFPIPIRSGKIGIINSWKKNILNFYPSLCPPYPAYSIPLCHLQTLFMIYQRWKLLFMAWSAFQHHIQKW